MDKWNSGRMIVQQSVDGGKWETRYSQSRGRNYKYSCRSYSSGYMSVPPAGFNVPSSADPKLGFKTGSKNCYKAITIDLGKTSGERGSTFALRVYTSEYDRSVSTAGSVGIQDHSWAISDVAVAFQTLPRTGGCGSCDLTTTFQPFTGQIGRASCKVKSCPAGQQLNPLYTGTSGGNVSLCNACDAGMFQPAAGPQNCRSCAPGMYTSAKGATRCKAGKCAQGKHLATSTADTCTLCGLGQYTSGSDTPLLVNWASGGKATQSSTAPPIMSQSGSSQYPHAARAYDGNVNG